MRKYKTKSVENRRYYIAFDGKEVVPVVFATIKGAAQSIGVSVQNAQRSRDLKRLFPGGKWILVCTYQSSENKGGKFKNSKDIEQTRMSKWREDITYDEA